MFCMSGPGRWLRILRTYFVFYVIKMLEVNLPSDVSDGWRHEKQLIFDRARPSIVTLERRSLRRLLSLVFEVLSLGTAR
jgi:hypothetical protein